MPYLLWEGRYVVDFSELFSQNWWQPLRGEGGCGTAHQAYRTVHACRYRLALNVRSGEWKTCGTK